MAIPTTDAALAIWSANANTRGVAAPTDYGLTAAQMALYTPLHEAFFDAYQAANAGDTKSKALVAAKDSAKLALLKYARQLYAFVQANDTVSDARKLELGVTVRDFEPTPKPAPTAAPALAIVSVYGRTVRLTIKDASGVRRGRPVDVAAAALFSYVGEAAPEGPSGWVSEGYITRPDVLVEFDPSVTPPARVWFTAQWINTRGETGPATSPVSAHIGFEGALPMAG